MKSIGIIGSGPSGIAAAWLLSNKGLPIELIDVGHMPEPWSTELANTITHRLLKNEVPSPKEMAQLRNGLTYTPPSLYQSLSALLKSNIGAEKLNKRIIGSSFVYEGVNQAIPVTGATVPLSLSSGGLSNLWGAACYSLTDRDIDEWPFDYSALAPHYEKTAKLLRLWQVKDGLARAYPLFGPTLVGEDKLRNPGSPLEKWSNQWRNLRDKLDEEGICAGKSRLAVRNSSNNDSNPIRCLQCGLCFYGCPTGAIFTSRHVLKALKQQPGFHYHSNFLASHFVEKDSEISVYGTDPANGQPRKKKCQTLLLAGGPLSSYKIAAQSLNNYRHPVSILDNDLYILPFLPKSIPNVSYKNFKSRFSLSEAAIYLHPGSVSSKGVHIQFYTFNDYFLGSLATAIEKLPRSWENLIRSTFNRLIIGFVYFHSDESRQAQISLQKDKRETTSLHIEVNSEPPSRQLLKKTLRYLSKNQKLTGLIPLAPLAKQTPFGFSGHLGGTLAMKEHPRGLQTNPEGRLLGCRRVYCIDSSTFPTMSAQNPTFTIMSNAMRIADGI